MATTAQNRTASKGPTQTSTPNRVLDDYITARGGSAIDGAETRDPTNSPVYFIQAGMPVGRLTATGKYAPSAIGTSNAYTNPATTLTTTAASATELVRRLGSSGTFNLQGISASVFASVQVTFSAVNTSTGDITVTAIGQNFDVGAWIQIEDGTEVVVTIYQGFNEGFPERVTEDVTNTDVDISFLPAIEAWVLEDNVTFWPAAGVFRDNLRAELNVSGKFFFRDNFVG